MAYQKDIEAAFAEVKEFDFYEAFTQNELIYISQAIEAYASQSTASLQAELEEARKRIGELEAFVKDVARGQYGELKGTFIHRITLDATKLISNQSPFGG